MLARSFRSCRRCCRREAPPDVPGGNGERPRRGPEPGEACHRPILADRGRELNRLRRLWRLGGFACLGLGGFGASACRPAAVSFGFGLGLRFRAAVGPSHLRLRWRRPRPADRVPSCLPTAFAFPLTSTSCPTVFPSTTIGVCVPSKHKIVPDRVAAVGQPRHDGPAERSPPSTSRSWSTCVSQTLFPAAVAEPPRPSIRRSCPIESPLMTMPAGFVATRSCLTVTLRVDERPAGATVRSWVTVVPAASTQVAPLGTVTLGRCRRRSRRSRRLCRECDHHDRWWWWRWRWRWRWRRGGRRRRRCLWRRRRVGEPGVAAAGLSSEWMAGLCVLCVRDRDRSLHHGVTWVTGRTRELCRGDACLVGTSRGTVTTTAARSRAAERGPGPWPGFGSTSTCGTTTAPATTPASMTAASRRAKIPRLPSSPAGSISRARQGHRYEPSWREIFQPGWTGAPDSDLRDFRVRRVTEIPVIIPAGGRAPPREDALCR